MSTTEKEISRVPRSKQEARAAYDRLSRWYDLLAGGSERPFQEEGGRRLDVVEGERVLEVGCGTGHGLVALARQAGRSGRVYGLDLSAGMLQIARKRLAREGLLARVNLQRADAEAMPFAEDSFDALLVSFVLELFDTPQIPVVLQECRRVLRRGHVRGGRIAVVALSKKGDDGIMRRLYEWAHCQFPAWVDCRPIYVRQAIEDAGFKVLQAVERSMWGLPVEIVVAQAT